MTLQRVIHIENRGIAIWGKGRPIHMGGYGRHGNSFALIDDGHLRLPE